MNFNDIVNKAKGALQSNPDLVKKAGDAVNKATGGKFASQVNAAQEAAEKAVGGNQPQAEQPAQPQADKPADDQQK